ncbi:hypothetical protein MKW94_014573 [Papaver nudicaule]|uniref:Protein kinase domain-containing protein n=1 Tax=Papaver nudicaule TaxID=74823 RepID=A0AA41V1N2_PAPNU|nr:hypothetical protein [Papaver nudicaule]
MLCSLYIVCAWLMVLATVLCGSVSHILLGFMCLKIVPSNGKIALDFCYSSSEKTYFYVEESVVRYLALMDGLVEFIGATVEPEMMIVTENMRGGSLQKYLYNMRPRCPDLRQSISFALDISRGMACLHSNGIIHRDLNLLSLAANMLLTEDCTKLKLAHFGMAREKTVGEVMTCEAVFWELLTDCTPFKGMSNMQAAFSVASKNARPNIEKLPKEFLSLVESRWAEDPRTRPEVTEISIILSHYLKSITSAPHLDKKNEQQQQQQLPRISSQVEPDSPDTHQLIEEQMGDKVILKKLLSKNSSAGSRSCFGKCSLG